MCMCAAVYAYLYAYDNVLLLGTPCPPFFRKLEMATLRTIDISNRHYNVYVFDMSNK